MEGEALDVRAVERRVRTGEDAESQILRGKRDIRV